MEIYREEIALREFADAMAEGISEVEGRGRWKVNGKVVVRHSKILRESERNPATEIERRKAGIFIQIPGKLSKPLFSFSLVLTI